MNTHRSLSPRTKQFLHSLALSEYTVLALSYIFYDPKKYYFSLFCSTPKTKNNFQRSHTFQRWISIQIYLLSWWSFSLFWKLFLGDFSLSTRKSKLYKIMNHNCAARSQFCRYVWYYKTIYRQDKCKTCLLYIDDTLRSLLAPEVICTTDWEYYYLMSPRICRSILYFYFQTQF